MAADITNLFPNKEQFDTMNALLASIAYDDGTAVSSWRAVGQAVRTGGAPVLFPVGTQLVCQREKTVTADAAGSTGITGASVLAEKFLEKTGSAYGGIYEFSFDGHAWRLAGEPVELSDYGISTTGESAEGDVIEIHETTDRIVWDVVAHDYNTDPKGIYKHSMTLLTHDCVERAMQYDSAEALYFCEDGLDAGTYHFTLHPEYDRDHGGGKTLQFTLASPVPANGIIVFPWIYYSQSTEIKISTYSSPSDKTAIETVPVTEGNGGIDLGTADGNTANMNHTHRIRCGSNNWRESAIRQFLNSAAPAGQIWNPQTRFDMPPQWAASKPGWMYGLDPEFLAVIGEAKILNISNSAYETNGNAGESYYTADRFWLPSASEIFGEAGGAQDGEQFPYFADSSNADRVKYGVGQSAGTWWLRTPLPSNPYSQRNVIEDGSLSYYNATGLYGIAVACAVF